MKKFSWKLALIIVGIALALLVAVVFGVQGVQNKAISYEEQISTAMSDVKIQEKKRADLIPNLVDCVKAYDKHEYNTMVDVIEKRGVNSDSAAEEITTMISAVAEQYPALASNENYKNLMNELTIIENEISTYREYYNIWVKRYNSYVRKFPNNLILKNLGYEIIENEYLNFDVSEDAPTNLFGEN